MSGQENNFFFNFETYLMENIQIQQVTDFIQPSDFTNLLNIGSETQQRVESSTYSQQIIKIDQFGSVTTVYQTREVIITEIYQQNNIQVNYAEVADSDAVFADSEAVFEDIGGSEPEKIAENDSVILIENHISIITVEDSTGNNYNCFT